MPQRFQGGEVTGFRATGDRAVALRDAVDHSGHRAVRRRQMVGDAIEMEIGPRVEDRSAHGDADGTAGATAKTCGNPRRICGSRSWSPPQSWVMKPKLHIEKPNRARPNIISHRVSNLRARRMYTGTPTSEAAPVQNIQTPAGQGLRPLAQRKNSYDRKIVEKTPIPLKKNRKKP